MAPVLIAMTGLAVDVSFWITQHTALQSATDAAAMKAARDISNNPATPPVVLNSDALTAAIAAAPKVLRAFVNGAGYMALSAGSRQVFTLTQPGATEVKVSASTPADIFFSSVLALFPGGPNTSLYAISTSSEAATPPICYSIDSDSYLFSAGLGTIDTAHSAGIDPYRCGATPPSPPPAYTNICATANSNGGILGCNLDLLGLGNDLLPFAITIGPSPPAGFRNFDAIVAPVLGTLNNVAALLNGNGLGVANGTMDCTTSVSGGASSTACNLTAGSFAGGLSLPAGTAANPVTVAFGAGSYLISNGDLIIPTQDNISANNAIFYFNGTTPGGLVEATQVPNTAVINNGYIVMTSSSTFTSNSLVGTQTSAPISAYPNAELYESQQGVLPAVTLNGNNGSLSFLGMPAGNVVGTNFLSFVATCAQATSNCPTPNNPNTVSIQPLPVNQRTVIPSLTAAAVTTLTSTLGLGNIPVIALLTSNQGETSTTQIASALTFADGAPTDWWQQETAVSTLNNAMQNLNGVLGYLGLSGIAAAVASPTINTALNLLAALGLQSTGTTTQTYSNNGVFPSQTSVLTPSASSCANQATLYSNTITPSFSPSFSDILDSGGANNANGVNGSLTTTDNVTICGTGSASGGGVYLIQ